jgi:hypothetical protein
MMRMTSMLAAALVLAACNGDATGATGSGDARMQVAMRGDDAPASQSVQSADGGAPSFTSTTAEGTIDFRARVYVQSSTSGWVELTNGAAGSGSVDASGRGSAVAFASSRVDAGSYTRVRVVFEDVEANLNGGLQISTGLLTGSVSVNLESDGQVVVEREVNVSASSGATSQVLINLNADAWLNQASATTHTVSEASFRNAVAITAQ